MVVMWCCYGAVAMDNSSNANEKEATTHIVDVDWDLLELTKSWPVNQERTARCGCSEKI